MTLDDIKVADFTQLMQGPWATQKMAELGADVVKIEPPGGEWMRDVALGGELYEGTSPWFLAVNRNKRSIVLDLKQDEGRSIARDIVSEADVLVENFRPGVLEKFNLGYDDVCEFNTDVIYVSASGYGPDGPYADRPAQDLLLQGLSGMASYTGRASDPPTPTGTAIVDEHSAMLVAFNTAVALYHRERTGEGQRVEVNLFDSAIDLQCQEITAALTMDRKFERSELGIAHAFVGAPYGIYETADGYISISNVPLTDIREVFQIDSLREYDDPTSTFENRDEIKQRIEQYTRQYPAEELLKDLLDADVWAAEVQRYEDLPDDPQVDHNDMLVEVDHPEVGSFVTTGIPTTMSKSQPGITSPPPTTGEHSEEILANLDYSRSEIDAFVRNRVVETADVPR